MSIIQSARYGIEAERLSHSPKIREMAQAIPRLPEAEYASWPFISAASAEANRQGVPGIESIGGPALAVKILHDKGVHA